MIRDNKLTLQKHQRFKSESHNVFTEKFNKIDVSSNDDMIADMLCNKKVNPIVAELFIRGRKLNFFFFYHIILFCSFKKYQTKFNTLFCYENHK